MNNNQKIEGLLFYKGEPISIKKIAGILNITEEETIKSLKELEDRLKNSGLQLICNNDTVVLGTHKEMSTILSQFKKEELEKELSKASLETLSIILYQNGVKKSTIDYIRGVNSGFILRALMVRGLIERTGMRGSYIYKPTIDTLAYLGLTNINDLPEIGRASCRERV